MRIHGAELNKWVYQEIRRRIPDISEDFMEGIKNYLEKPEEHKLEKKILRAAHYLATQWEFEIIYHFNQGIYGVDETKRAINSEIEDHYDLAGVQKLALKGKSSKFVDLIGKLRFQQFYLKSNL